VIKRVIASRESGLRYAFADYCETTRIQVGSFGQARDERHGVGIAQKRLAIRECTRLHFFQVNRHEL
jgi:hypothetical protein